MPCYLPPSRSLAAVAALLALAFSLRAGRARPEAAPGRRARPHRRRRERRGHHAQRSRRARQARVRPAQAAGHAAAAARRARKAAPRPHDHRPRAAAVRQGNRVARGRRRARPGDRAHRRGEQDDARRSCGRRSRSDGVPFAKFREDIRNEIIMARLREREVDNRIVVTDGEIDNFIKTQQTQASGSDEYNLSHILVTVPENASPEQIQTRRARAEQALAAGEGRHRLPAGRRGVFRRARRAAGRRHGLARREPAADAVHGRAAEDAARRGDGAPAQRQRLSRPAAERTARRAARPVHRAVRPGRATS